MEQLHLNLKIGFGLMNEQWGELIHVEFNCIARIVHGMQGELQILMAIMQRKPEYETLAKTWRNWQNHNINMVWQGGHNWRRCQNDGLFCDWRKTTRNRQYTVSTVDCS